MRNADSILWDFFQKLGCHDTLFVLVKNNHQSKRKRLICRDDYFPWQVSTFLAVKQYQMARQ